MLSGLKLYSTASENGQYRFHSNGAASRVIAGVQGSRDVGFKVTANNLVQPGGSAVGQNVVSKNTMVNLLDGFIIDDPQAKRRLYQDMYRHDAICGGAIEIFANIPFSSFDLTGLNDEEALEYYQKSCDNMRCQTLLPALARDYLTLGVFIGTTLFDKVQKIFTNVMPQSINNCKVTEVPIYGVDPIIDLEVPPALKKMLKDKDPRLQGIFKNIPRAILDDLNKGKVQLPPETTLYIPRRTLTNDWIGTSYLERVLPVWMYAKTLYRGTLDQANRRQRSIFHIVAGDDEWIPPQEDLNNIRDLFMQADTDPTGAIIVTRPSISPNEVREATSFFRYDEVDPYFSQAMYRGLGITEAMITGEFSVATIDASLTMIVDSFRSFRHMLTRDIFYDKIFPAVALANNFKREDYMVKGSKYRSTADLRVTCEDRTRSFKIKGMNYNTSNLAIPSINWHKHLKPEGDATYIDMLANLTERGVPVTLSMYTAAAGINLDQLVESMDTDLALRKKISGYMKQVNKMNAESAPPEAQAREILAALASDGTAVKRVGLLEREFDDSQRYYERKKNGKYRLTSKRRVREMTERANKMIGQQLAERARYENKRLREGKGERKVMSSGVFGIIK
jgi:hypothetical protein